jgi:hypothetical protein
LPALPAAVSVDRGGLGPVLIATCQPDRSGRVNAAPLLALTILDELDHTEAARVRAKLDDLEGDSK